ncbi:MAG: hypothetical protein JXQ93_06855 [Flavobacteriaceae bacterium]
MNKTDYLKDISEIKNLMNKSSRFISLSGLSGIMAGIYAIIGAAIGYWFITDHGKWFLIFDDKEVFNLILLNLVIIFFMSVSTAIFLTVKKAKRNGEKMWDSTSKRVLISFLTPLITGGVYILIILAQQRYDSVSALMLLFYGLSLVNASKHTLRDIKFLGYIEIVLGLICAALPGYGFWLWILGFGVMHIIYGTLMYFKYDKKRS